MNISISLPPWARLGGHRPLALSSGAQWRSLPLPVRLFQCTSLGRRLCCSQEDVEVRAATSLALSRAFVVGEHKAAFNVEFSPDGKVLVALYEDGAVAFLDPLSGGHHASRPLVEFKAHNDAVNVCCFMSGNILLTGGDDQLIKSWDVRKLGREPVRIYNMHTGPVKNIDRFSADHFFSVGFGSSLYVSRLEDPNYVREFSRSSQFIRAKYCATTNSLAFSLFSGDVMVVRNVSLPDEEDEEDGNLLPIVRVPRDGDLAGALALGESDAFSSHSLQHATRQRYNRVEYLRRNDSPAFASSMQSCQSMLLLRVQNFVDCEQDMCEIYDLFERPLVTEQLSDWKDLGYGRAVDDWLHSLPCYSLRYEWRDSCSDAEIIREPCFSPCGLLAASPYFRGVRVFRLDARQDSSEVISSCSSTTLRAVRSRGNGRSAVTSLRSIAVMRCPLVNTHRAEVFSCRFHPHLPFLASCAADGSVKLFAGEL